MPISEAELILPTLHILSKTNDGEITTTELSLELREILKPNGEDLKGLKNRNDDKFSQKVRNLVSHKTLQRLGYATYKAGKLKITAEGRSYIKEDLNKIDIEEKYDTDFEGSETIEIKEEEEENNDEGFGIISEDVELVYPQAALNIERTQFSLYELKRKQENNKLILDPDFQRNEVWKNIQKAELIESILMNIPLPFIYLTENKKGNLVVIDGRQRLTALFEFIDNKFSLGKNLKILKNLHNKKFSDLDPLLQGTIEDYQLITHVIKPPTSDRVMIDIFDRVNRSGTKLNNQEIRNALYQGKSTKLLKSLSESEDFKIATNYSVKSDRMKDKYIILRAISFYLWKKRYDDLNPLKGLVDYKGDTEDFLAKYMEYVNGLPDEDVASLKNMFLNSINDAYRILGEDVFRLPSKKNSNIKRPINMALFEALIYLFADEEFNSISQYVKLEYITLMKDQEFLNSFLSIDSNTKFRFNKIEEIKNRLRNVR